MSTVSQFLAMASGGSGSLTPFREVYQNTDTPYAYTTSSPVVLNLSTAPSIYDLQTPHPGVPAMVHDTSVTNDIVIYNIGTVYDHHNGYTVAASTKNTLTSSTSVTVLVNNLTGAVFEITPPTGGINMLVYIIGNDGFLYAITAGGPGLSNTLATTSTGAINSTASNFLRTRVFSLATGATVATIDASTSAHGVVNADGGSNSAYNQAYMWFSRPTAANTGYFVMTSVASTSNNSSPSSQNGTEFISAGCTAKINFNGASTTYQGIYFDTSSGSGPGTGSQTSGTAQGLVNVGISGCQGGYVASHFEQIASTSSISAQTTLMILDETREVGTNTHIGSAPSNAVSGTILKDGTTLVYVQKQSGTQFIAVFAGDTQASRTFTLTQANPALTNAQGTASTWDFCSQYGTYKNRFICGPAVYTMNATAKTLTYNKTLYTIPGNNTILPCPSGRNWERAIYLTNSVSGQITQLLMDGVDVNAADPTVIQTVSGSPPGFGGSTSVFGWSLNFTNFFPNVSGMNGLSTSQLTTYLGKYAVVSGERFTRSWGGITSGSTVTASSDLGLTGRVQYLSGSNYTNATVKGLLTGSAVRFDKVRFTVRLPAYTNTSTGASTILLRILANANEFKNLRIVNTPSQDVYVHSSTQLGIRVGASTNIVAEDVIIEADTILRFTGGGLLVDNTYSPMSGTITLTLSNLAAASRLMSELFE